MQVSGTDEQDANSHQSLMDEIRNRLEALDLETQRFQQETSTFDRNKIQSDINDLESRKWINQNIEAIRKEKDRRKNQRCYEKWIDSSKTTSISNKAKQISEKSLTQAYIDRFNKELFLLCNGRIMVELGIASGAKGQVLHAISLKNCPDSKELPINILSDGEKRIVELAAFLADTMVSHNKSPFVFDDPISSLDQEFEGKVVERLCQLSKERQVIVFTHRLSLLGNLQDASDCMESINILHHSDSSGVVSDFKNEHKKPESALNKLINEHLSKAKKHYDAQEIEDYNHIIKSMCGNFRIVLEIIVERSLLNDVVARHRKELQTKNKLNRLHLIQRGDCVLIENMMTKYSYPEHSQPVESPLPIATLDELKTDLLAVFNWLEEFKKRQ
jgi:energy-coupling factor transporter ATP-binding protein EcfA2